MKELGKGEQYHPYTVSFIPHINEEPMKQNEKYGCESADEQQQDDEKNRQQ